MKRTRKPKIGVTGPDRGGFAAWTATRFAIWRAGGEAIRITPSRKHVFDDIDGLVIGGGADVGLLEGEEQPPQSVNESPWWQARLTDILSLPLELLLRVIFGKHQRKSERSARDKLEFACFDHARQHRYPVIGICRGAQLINVALGGRLHRDLASFYVESRAIRSVLPRKEVAIEPGTRLAKIIARPRCFVNALHRQAIDDDALGHTMKVAALETNGVVQAIESESEEWFLIGVQWHPEYLPQRAEQRRLFDVLINAARSKR